MTVNHYRVTVLRDGKRAASEIVEADCPGDAWSAFCALHETYLRNPALAKGPNRKIDMLSLEDIRAESDAAVAEAQAKEAEVAKARIAKAKAAAEAKAKADK